MINPLRRIRINKGFTQQEIADEINLLKLTNGKKNKKNICMWEKGYYIPNRPIIDYYADQGKILRKDLLAELKKYKLNWR